MNSQKRETAALAGGCFWCLEAVFAEVEGVEKVVSGYAGGIAEDPTYQEVCTGTTGHAEVVQVTFDPELITYRELLEIFFSIHDPTTLNRQGPDVGTQYRSAIFYEAAEQKEVAEELMRELESAGLWDEPIVTEVKPLDVFYPGEPYHQNYYERNPSQPYCAFVITPKIAKFREKHAAKLKA